MKPFTEKELAALMEVPDDVQRSVSDYGYAASRNLEGKVIRDTAGSACYAPILRNFDSKVQKISLGPRKKYMPDNRGNKETFSLPPKMIQQFFKALWHVRLLDRKHTTITYTDGGLPEIVLAPGIDYVYLYITACFYRMIESRSPIAYQIVRLYPEAKKRGIKFLQCFMYVARTHGMTSSHFFLPSRHNSEYLASPAYGNALWKLMRSSAETRGKLLGSRNDGLVWQEILKLHDELTEGEIHHVRDSSPDILHPYFGPLFVNTKLSAEKYKKMMKDAPVPTEVLTLRESPYQGYY